MVTKLQSQTNTAGPRVVFISCFHADEFTPAVRDALRKKLDDTLDATDRPFELFDSRDGLSGDAASIVPWERTPTDVVILFSDEYKSKLRAFVGAGKIEDNAVAPELNYVLRHGGKRPAPFHVWFGVVQETLWRRVLVEGSKLEGFVSEILDWLRPDYATFCNDPRNLPRIDTETAQAAERISDHDTSTCPRCKEED